MSLKKSSEKNGMRFTSTNTIPTIDIVEYNDLGTNWTDNFKNGVIIFDKKKYKLDSIAGFGKDKIPLCFLELDTFKVKETSYFLFQYIICPQSSTTPQIMGVLMKVEKSKILNTYFDDFSVFGMLSIGDFNNDGILDKGFIDNSNKLSCRFSFSSIYKNKFCDTNQNYIKLFKKENLNNIFQYNCKDVDYFIKNR